MPAIDTIAAFATAGAASPFPTAMAAAPGDSLTIRNFPTGQTAGLMDAFYSAGGGQKFRITSPNLHDPQTGLTWQPAEIPSRFLLPDELIVPLQANDTLTLQGGLAAAGTMVAGLPVYYSQLPGIQARLHSWGDIAGNIKFVKSVEVDLGAIAVGAWTDTLITATENQLHSNKDYAVLGLMPSVAIDIIGVKGSATGNLRVCAPGTTATTHMPDWFIWLSNQLNLPCIPVFNSDDRFAFYVSAFNHAAIGGGASSVYVVVAELLNTVTP